MCACVSIIKIDKDFLCLNFNLISLSMCNCKPCITQSVFTYRGAVLCRKSLRVTCPGHSLRVETLKKLNAVCDTLRDSAAILRQHGYKTQAAETALEQAKTLR